LNQSQHESQQGDNAEDVIGKEISKQMNRSLFLFDDENCARIFVKRIVDSSEKESSTFDNIILVFITISSI